MDSDGLDMMGEVVLEEVMEFAPGMGVERRRTLRTRRELLVRDRAALIFPRRASRIVVQLEVGGTRFVVGSTKFLYIPEGSLHSEVAESLLSDVFVLLPDEGIVRRMVVDNRIVSDVAVVLERPTLLPLSRWLDDLVERYAFERFRNSHSPPGCPSFLETQIMNEFARILFPDVLETTGDVIGVPKDEPFRRAIDWFEKHLFENFSVEEAALAVGVGSSQLHKQFVDSIGMGPMAFRSNLRLDEAARLVRRREWSLTDIATITGFSDLSAFSRAFRKKFGVPPGKYD